VGSGGPEWRGGHRVSEHLEDKAEVGEAVLSREGVLKSSAGEEHILNSAHYTGFPCYSGEEKAQGFCQAFFGTLGSWKYWGWEV
jgi:hypothetical protein